MWQDVQGLMQRNGFVCTEDFATGNILCGYNSSCSYIVNFMPTLHLNFYGSESGTTFYVPIPPDYYLQSEDNDSVCMSLLVWDDQEVSSFVLGVPFFRATTLQLNYNATTVSVYLDTKEDSPIEAQWPSSIDGAMWAELLDVNVGLNYTGRIYVGEDFQYGTNILFDTGSRLSIIPSSSGSSGWFDEDDSSVTIDTNNQFDYTLDTGNFACTMAYADFCGNNVNSTVSAENDCGYVGFCLADIDSYPGGYEGMIALGKWDSNDTEISYVMKQYLQYGVKPSIVIDLNFEG